MGGIKRTGEGEPGTECLVVRRVDTQIVRFERWSRAHMR